MDLDYHCRLGEKKTVMESKWIELEIKRRDTKQKVLSLLFSIAKGKDKIVSYSG